VRSFIIASAAALAGLAVALPAQAALVLTPTSASLGATDIGSTFTVNYNGYPGKDTSNVLAGLTATGIFTLASVGNSGTQFVFNYSIDNTSKTPVTDSRISIFGFNVDPNVAPTSASATGLFGGSVSSSGNNPAVELCFLNKTSGNGCTGGGGNGVSIEDDPATGILTLNFASAPTTVTLDNFYIRYQSLVSTASSETSARGSGTVAAAVPEPATWGMMILGFGLVGASMRYRRRATRIRFA
jgi:hypothetical protein